MVKGLPLCGRPFTDIQLSLAQSFSNNGTEIDNKPTLLLNWQLPGPAFEGRI
jgi:hypothetical protein